jgi:hypothetical protein
MGIDVKLLTRPIYWKGRRGQAALASTARANTLGNWQYLSYGLFVRDRQYLGTATVWTRTKTGVIKLYKYIRV